MSEYGTVWTWCKSVLWLCVLLCDLTKMYKRPKKEHQNAALQLFSDVGFSELWPVEFKRKTCPTCHSFSGSQDGALVAESSLTTWLTQSYKQIKRRNNKIFYTLLSCFPLFIYSITQPRATHVPLNLGQFQISGLVSPWISPKPTVPNCASKSIYILAMRMSNTRYKPIKVSRLSSHY